MPLRPKFIELKLREQILMAAKAKAKSNPQAFLQQAGPGTAIRVYRNRETIYSQGDPSDAVFYLQSGMVKLTITSKHSRKKAVLAVLQEGDFFGEACLGREHQRTSSATSMGPSTITRVEKAMFRRKMDHDPVFAAMFIKYLLLQITRFKADLADHFLNFSDRRLARILLIHMGHSKKSKKGHSVPQFSQTMLAEMVGTTRARISTFMNKFRGKGYVRYNGGLQINSERLNAFLKD